MTSKYTQKGVILKKFEQPRVDMYGYVDVYISGYVYECIYLDTSYEYKYKASRKYTQKSVIIKN